MSSSLKLSDLFWQFAKVRTNYLIISRSFQFLKDEEEEEEKKRNLFELTDTLYDSTS